MQRRNIGRLLNNETESTWKVRSWRNMSCYPEHIKYYYTMFSTTSLLKLTGPLKRGNKYVYCFRPDK
jgi:hypothetical protein